MIIHVNTHLVADICCLKNIKSTCTPRLDWMTFFVGHLGAEETIWSHVSAKLTPIFILSLSTSTTRRNMWLWSCQMFDFSCLICHSCFVLRSWLTLNFAWNSLITLYSSGIYLWRIFSVHVLTTVSPKLLTICYSVSPLDASTLQSAEFCFLTPPYSSE